MIRVTLKSCTFHSGIYLRLGLIDIYTYLEFLPKVRTGFSPSYSIKKATLRVAFFSAPRWARTIDQKIMSLLL